jgi:ACS family glucarate transporter-like MFS transporter
VERSGIASGGGNVTHASSEARPPARRAGLLAFLCALSIITYLDRVCIGIAAPRMQDDLGIGPAQWGWVIGAFSLSYGILELPLGALGDRIGPQKVLTRIAVTWSIFTGLTGAVSTLWTLIVARFLFGAGEAGAFPNIASALTRVVAPRERARAQGLIWSMSRIGGALAPLLVLPLQRAYGWRASFWVFGLVGVLWAVAWSRWSRRAFQGLGVGAASGTHERIPWRAILTDPRVQLLMSVYWFYVWGSWFYLQWIQTYLMKGRGFSEMQMGLTSGGTFVASAVGCVAGGALSDALTQRYGARVGRIYLGSAGLLVSSICLYGTSQAESSRAVVVLSLLGFGSLDVILPCAWAAAMDVGGRYAGAVSGAMNSMGQFGAFACSIAFGQVAASGRYDIAVFLVAAAVLVSAVLFALIQPRRAAAW